MKNRFWFEKKELDFPFYTADSSQLSTGAWLIILLFPFLGFLFLTLVYIPALSPYGNQLLSGIILLLSALAGLRIGVGKEWTTLFKKVRLKDLLMVLGYVGAALITAAIIGGIVELFSGTLVDNPVAIKATGDHAWLIYLSLRFQELFQLLGEEFLAILPFLAILHWCTLKAKLNRKTGIVIAWIVSSVLFGLLHLPTYEWNVIQCIFVIGGSRLLLTLPYVQSKNLWLSFLVHYLYDMLIFTAAFLS